MILNETRNVFWHESCKCVCKLNSSICSNKQIWNGDTCKCDCNEDFIGIINCTKGYTWNPSVNVILANVNVIRGVNQDNI